MLQFASKEAKHIDPFRQFREEFLKGLLGSGTTHPNFVASLQALSPAAHALVAKVAPAFC